MEQTWLRAAPCLSKQGSAANRKSAAKKPQTALDEEADALPIGGGGAKGGGKGGTSSISGGHSS